MAIATIDPVTLKRRLDEGSAILIDIREAAEFAGEHIAGARLAPLSSFALQEIVAEPGKAVVFCCLSGMRTAKNAGLLESRGLPDVYVLAGGLNAWKAAGLPVSC